MSSSSMDTQVISNNSKHKSGTDDTQISSDKNHKSLVGSERLFSLVHHLGNSCPWTASVDALTMLSWLSSEVDELKYEIEHNNKQEIISELGDILFDALMLEMICRKTFQFSKQQAWHTAAEKVERRTPYMKEWGDGVSIANTPEEATVLWNAAKAEEKKGNYKKDKKPKQQGKSIMGSFWRVESVNTKVVSAAAVGFILGVYVSNLGLRRK